MNCKKCGEPLQENETICTKCGTENRDVVENIAAAPNLRGFSSKKNIIIIALAGVLAIGIGGTAAAFGVSNMPANRVSRYMGAAERYLSEQNYEQAIIEFQRILEIDPMNVDAYLGMAESYMAMGDIDNAVEILRTGLEQTDDDHIREQLNELLLSLALESGNTYLLDEKYPQAESEFSDALEIDEKCVEAYIGKADSHFGSEDMEKAIEVLQKGFDMTSDSGIKEKLGGLKLSEALKHGHEYLTAEKYQQAESEFVGALDIDEKCVEAYIGKADSHIGKDDIDKAIETLQKGYDLTGDRDIKEKLNALIKEQSKLKLSWSNVDGNVVYIKYGHYVKRVGDLWQPCDATGKTVSDKKYKYIKDFCGTDKANYTLITTEDKRVFCVDKKLTELFELDFDPDVVCSYTIIDQLAPLILSWHPCIPGAGEIGQYLDIYTPNGKLVYQWKRNECLDGSGAPAYFDDPVFDFTDEFRAKCTDTDYTTHDFDSIKTSLTGVSISNSKLYVGFEIDIPFLTSSSNGSFSFGASGYHTAYETVSVSVEDGVVKMKRYDDYLDSEVYDGSGGDVLYENGDRRIFCRLGWSLKEPSVYIMTDGDQRKAFEVHDFYSRNSYDPIELGDLVEKLNFFSITSLVDDRFMICQKPANEVIEANENTVYTGNEESVYALFKINWQDFEKVNSDKIEWNSAYQSYQYVPSRYVEYNNQHERVSEFYDNISTNDEEIEMGCLLVGKDGKWGYISLEIGEELAMYDDASNFSNGYAVVTNNGKGCIIDSEFNVVSDEFPCESAHILGDGSFIVTNGDEIKRLVIIN